MKIILASASERRQELLGRLVDDFKIEVIKFDEDTVPFEGDIDKYVKADTTVFDIGTGSGILALVASKLGAKHVIGVDLDPVAVDSAKENISFNNVDNIEVLYGNLLDVVDGKADIVVANIIAEIICILVDDVKKALNKDGIFITSGIIHERRQMVIDKLEQEGFEVMEVNKDGEWNCIVAKLK